MERMEREMKKVRAEMAKLLAEIEEVREIAESYYNAASQEVRAQAKHFFNSMDRNGDGKVNLEEFLSFMRSEGYTQMRNNSFFKMLDTTGHGTLKLMDVMTLYYIIKSGRPFCSSCREFITGTFFSCLTCFNRPNNSFIICRRCHKSKKYDHRHGGRSALFLDNYTLLHATKLHSPSTSHQPLPATKNEPTREKSRGRSATPRRQRPISATDYMSNELARVLAKSQSRSQSQPRSCRLDRSLSVTAAKQVATTSTPNTHSERRRDTHQRAIVPVTKPISWKDIASASFKALDKMIIVSNVVAVVSACTIM